MSASYEPVIGLEIHVQLATRTKMFCGCERASARRPTRAPARSASACPARCRWSTRRPIHYGLMIGLALGCEIAPRSIFHRKNYFYPDLPKGYQISQYDIPLCRGGRLGDVRHPPHPPRGGRGEARARRRVGPHPRLRRVASSTTTAAARRWSRSSPSPTSTRPSRRATGCTLLRETLRQLGVSRREHGGGLAALRRQRLRPPGGHRRARHQDRAQEHELVPLRDAGHQRRDRAPDRAARGGEPVVAGDAALRPGQRAAQLAALQGGGARLPLLPRARPRAARRRREEMLRGRARRAARAAGRARGALRARLRRCPTDTARLFAFEPELGRLLRGGAAARRRRRRRRSANWVTELRARLGADADPARSKVVAGRARQARRRSSRAETVTAGAARARCSTGWSPSGGDPAEIVEREGLGAMGDGGELDGDRRRGDRREPGRRRAHPRRQRRRRSGALVGPVMRETKGRADGGEVNRLLREQLGI